MTTLISTIWPDEKYKQFCKIYITDKVNDKSNITK